MAGKARAQDQLAAGFSDVTSVCADLTHFRQTILETPGIVPNHETLLIERSGRLACHYAPFEHINSTAKVVIAGITPGTQQARNALAALRDTIASGHDDAHALAIAKSIASFSGPIRSNLVGLLNRVGLHEALGLDSCARLFTDRSDLVQFTSVLRNPVFTDGKDYSGSPSILGTPALRRMTEQWLGKEIDTLNTAIWVPLGKEPTAVLQHFIALGRLSATQVLDGLPHPSGANAERIAYFLGTKARNTLSTKTNPDALDERRHEISQRVRALGADLGKAFEPSQA
jgi:hypothetical protein